MKNQNMIKFVFTVALSVFVAWYAGNWYASGELPLWRFVAYLAILAWLVVTSAKTTIQELKEQKQNVEPEGAEEPAQTEEK